jgi:hypothetical protein
MGNNTSTILDTSRVEYAGWKTWGAAWQKTVL